MACWWAPPCRYLSRHCPWVIFNSDPAEIENLSYLLCLCFPACNGKLFMPALVFWLLKLFKVLWSCVCASPFSYDFLTSCSISIHIPRQDHARFAALEGQVPASIMVLTVNSRSAICTSTIFSSATKSWRNRNRYLSLWLCVDYHTYLMYR